jgi:hypothetical protein
MKAVTASQPQMAEQDCGEGEENDDGKECQPSLNFVPQMFKSGLRAGQFITLTLFCCKKSLVALAVCARALSCWNVLL